MAAACGAGATRFLFGARNRVVIEGRARGGAEARVRRGLAALPGSIVMATVVPLSLRGGLPAMIGVACAVLAMMKFRNELIALLVGLGTVAALRAIGL